MLTYQRNNTEFIFLHASCSNVIHFTLNTHLYTGHEKHDRLIIKGTLIFASHQQKFASHLYGINITQLLRHINGPHINSLTYLLTYLLHGAESFLRS